MKSVLTTSVFLISLFVSAAHADVAAGQSAYAARGCIGCHGAGGVSVVVTYPSLEGRSADFIPAGAKHQNTMGLPVDE